MRKVRYVEVWDGRKWLRLPSEYARCKEADDYIRNSSVGAARVVVVRKFRRSYG